MRIGELSKRTGCGTDTIRYYEREGLLPAPDRSDGNYRLYGPAHLARLTFIRNCRALEMSLGEIRALLGIMDGEGGDCAEVAAVVERHIGHVTDRLERLGALRDQLVALHRRCAGERSIARCGILRELTSLQDAAAPAGSTDGCLDGLHGLGDTAD